MLTPVVQRWRDRVGSYRPAGEVIQTSRYEVAPIPGDSVARAFVVAHHYSASYPAARFRFGLYEAGELVGVAVFSHPCNDAVLDALPCDRHEATELGRLVLLNRVPGNGETWFIARCFELLRAQGVRGVVSFADPVVRTTLRGEVITPGHIGTIYQASNAVYAGRSSASKKLLLPDGTCLHARGLAKIRARDSRWRSAMAPLVRAGAEPLTETEDARAWVARWTTRLCRPIVHNGNHRYLFGLDRATKKVLPASLPYPKMASEYDLIAA